MKPNPSFTGIAADSGDGLPVQHQDEVFILADRLWHRMDPSFHIPLRSLGFALLARTAYFNLYNSQSQ
jgi:hypothetical protein